MFPVLSLIYHLNSGRLQLHSTEGRPNTGHCIGATLEQEDEEQYYVTDMVSGFKDIAMSSKDGPMKSAHGNLQFTP